MNEQELFCELVCQLEVNEEMASKIGPFDCRLKRPKARQLICWLVLVLD